MKTEFAWRVRARFKWFFRLCFFPCALLPCVSSSPVCLCFIILCFHVFHHPLLACILSSSASMYFIILCFHVFHHLLACVLSSSACMCFIILCLHVFHHPLLACVSSSSACLCFIILFLHVFHHPLLVCVSSSSVCLCFIIFCLHVFHHPLFACVSSSFVCLCFIILCFYVFHHSLLPCVSSSSACMCFIILCLQCFRRISSLVFALFLEWVGQTLVTASSPISVRPPLLALLGLNASMSQWTVPGCDGLHWIVLSRSRSLLGRWEKTRPESEYHRLLWCCSPYEFDFGRRQRYQRQMLVTRPFYRHTIDGLKRDCEYEVVVGSKHPATEGEIHSAAVRSTLLPSGGVIIFLSNANTAIRNILHSTDL